MLVKRTGGMSRSYVQLGLIVYSRWRALEAALAAIGSQAEAVQDCVEDEQDEGRDKPIDIEYLLSNVVPSVLGLSGPSLIF